MRDCNRKCCAVPVAVDNADHVPSSAIKFEETVQKGNLQNDDIRGQITRALRNESNQATENTSS